MEDSFGIAIGIVFVTLFNELLSQVIVIVDFAVVNDGFCSISVEHWLLTVGQVDNRKSTMTETNIPVYKYATFIWAAMCKGVPHLHERALVYRTARGQSIGDPINSTHYLFDDALLSLQIFSFEAIPASVFLDTFIKVLCTSTGPVASIDSV